MTSCGINKAVANIPLTFLDPIYGTPELTFTDFMAPGMWDVKKRMRPSWNLVYYQSNLLMERNLISEQLHYIRWGEQLLKSK